MKTEKNVNQIQWVSLIISVVGFFVSLYALYLHIINYLKPGHGSLCDINSQISCSSVIGSHYGELLNIPLGSYGMTYFIAILMLSLLPKITYVNEKTMSLIGILISAIGMGAVLGLVYVSYFILKIICPTCTIIHILVFLFTIYQIYCYFKSRKHGKFISNAFVSYLCVFSLLGVPPLAIGLIAPLIMNKIIEPAAEKKVVIPKDQINLEKLQKNNEDASFNSQKKSEALLAQNQNIKNLFLTFNKTNFVGNGEDFRKGSDDAPVIVQMFSDFGCPHCRDANEALSQAQITMGFDKVLFIYRFFPLSNKCNPYIQSEGWYVYTCDLSEAARCAGDQGSFFPMKDWAFQGQEWSDSQRAQNFSRAGLIGQAKSLGMDANIFEKCLSSHQELQKIKEDAGLANLQKIQGTPLILINGIEYKGTHSPDAFVQAFQKAFQENGVTR